jgi:hypothetical protein
MELFSWLNSILNPPEPIVLDDSYFGKLEYVSGKNIHGGKYEYWNCEKLTPISAEPLHISIRASIEGPSEADRIAAESLILKYAELQKDICRALFEEWREILSELKDAVVDPRDPHDEFIKTARSFDAPETMARLYELTSISIESAAEYVYELFFNYRGEMGRSDSTYVIVLVDRNWKVSYGGGGD